MRWVRIPTEWYKLKEYVNLPDRLWRFMVELDFLCGDHDGPVHADWDEIAWLMHREPQDVEDICAELLNMGRLEIIDGGIVPVGWLKRNEPYLNKMEYNRERYQQSAHEPKTKEADMAEKTADELWDELEGNGGRKEVPKDPLNVLRASGASSAEWRRWASRFRIVNTAPEDVQQASWILEEYGGVMPFGTKKAWTAQVKELLIAANNDMSVLEAAVKKAADCRNKKGITLSAPRSFINFARSEVGHIRLNGRQQVNGKQQKLIIDMDEDDRVKEVIDL